MGLDMMMYAQLEGEELEFDTYSTNCIEVGYWRKDNQIHSWFVREVQDNVDDCGYYEVTTEQIKDLRDICLKVLQDHSLAEELLEPRSGFFFGSTYIDEWYFEGLENTVTILKECIVQYEENPKVKFYYHSSW